MPPSADPSPTVGTATDHLSERPTFSEGPDDVFALVTGLYVALVVVPLAIAWLAGFASDGGTLYLAFVFGTLSVVTVVALAVRQIPGIDRRLGGNRVRWGLLAVPLVAAGASMAALTVVSGEPSGIAVVLGAVTAFGGLFAGGVLVTMAGTRYTKAIEQRGETLAEWRAAWPPQRRRVTQAIGALATFAGVAAFAAPLVWSEFPLRVLGHGLVPLGIVLFMFGHEPRTFRANTAGLVRQLPANRELYGWDRFEGYAVADDAVVIHFRAPWRFPLICDRSTLEDEDAVLDALEDNLPRLPAR